MKIKFQITRQKEANKIVELFDQYRIFYKQNSDLELGKSYLTSRLASKESLIFSAQTNDSDNKTEKFVGFVQLYPCYSSVGMNRIFILNDLYVEKDYRGQGIGSKLINHAENQLYQIGIKKVFLKTATDNPAQKLYEKHGYKKDEQFIHFYKFLSNSNNANDNKELEINKISKSISEDLISLFDNYRVFYKQPSDLDSCRQYLNERISTNESIIYEAKYKNISAGFVNLYPSYSSVSMQKIYILNDLFVDEKFRNFGIGSALINHAENELQKFGIKKITLKTATDNPAQELYKKLGYKIDSDFIHYNKVLNQESINLEKPNELELTGSNEITIQSDIF